MAAIPSSTWAGVLGITRTTGTPSASRASIEAVSTPAASETTRVSGLSESRISSSRTAMSCGLTTRITVSASATASSFSAMVTP